MASLVESGLTRKPSCCGKQYSQQANVSRGRCAAIIELVVTRARLVRAFHNDRNLGRYHRLHGLQDEEADRDQAVARDG